MSFLRLEGVSKRYRVSRARAGRQIAGGGQQAVDQDEIVALSDIDLTMERGEFVVVLGPSGCGKSTLLQIVAGLELPSSGDVSLDGRPIRSCSAERTLIFQRPNLFPWLTAVDNVAFGLRMAGYGLRERQALAEEALTQMSMGSAMHLYPHELSGGMQQRVALARALVLDPAVLLMDEPLASVDALLRQQLQREISTCCAGKTVLFVTHSVREALTLAHRIVILTAAPGRIRHQVDLAGTAPRPPSAALIQLEQDIERELLGGDG